MSWLYRIVVPILKPFIWLYYRPVAHGREYSGIEGPAIVICNHVTLGDPLLLAILFKRQLHFMAKVELFKNKFIGALLRALNAFPVNREEMDVRSVKNALSVLKEGHVFAIFPEGTRNKTATLLPLYKGFAFIALKAGVPIVPVCTREKGTRRHVRIGEHIDLVAELEGVPQHERVDTAVAVMQRKLQKVLDQL